MPESAWHQGGWMRRDLLSETLNDEEMGRQKLMQKL